MEQTTPNQLASSQTILQNDNDSNLSISVELQTTLIERAKKTFTTEQQLIFANNFYCYLKYNPIKDFVVDFDEIYQWLGFTTKGNAKRVLIKNYTENVDYKIIHTNSCIAYHERKAVFYTDIVKQNGGQNKENILMNIKTFKELCMIANTEKAKQVRTYYATLENMYFDLIKEEYTKQHNLITENGIKITTLENNLSDTQLKLDTYPSYYFYEEEIKRANNLHKSFQKVDFKYLQCFNICYILVLDEYKIINGIKRPIFKFGMSQRIVGRVTTHESKFKGCKMISVYVVSNCRMSETLMKDILAERGFHIESYTASDGKNHEEMFYTDPEINICDIDGIIKNACLPDMPLSKSQVTIDELNSITDTQKETIEDLKQQHRQALEQIKQLKKHNLKLTNKFDNVNKKHDDLIEVHDTLRLQDASLKAVNDQLKSEIETLKQIIHDKSQPPQINVNNNNTPTIQVTNQITTPPEYSKQTHKVCVTCDTPLPYDQFSNWITGKTHHECNKCHIKGAEAPFKTPNDANESQEHDEPRVLKCCNTCGIEKTLDSFFGFTPSENDGQSQKTSRTVNKNMCSACSSRYTKSLRRNTHFDKYIQRYKMKLLYESRQRKCTRCDTVKDISKFNKSKTGTFGHESLCSDCKKVRPERIASVTS